MPEDRTARILILLPVFNDWDCLLLLLPALGNELAAASMSAEVLIVNDGSTIPPPLDRLSKSQPGFSAIGILHLRRNLGHQRAIAIALTYAHREIPCSAVVVMDADGEDRPCDVIRLLHRHFEDGNKIVFAARMKRMETLPFRIFYRLYCISHRLLTGVKVYVGNFSVIPRTLLGRIVVISEIWNHYAAAVFRARLPFEALPADRGKRLASQSKMNFFSLLIHGLSALSVFGDVLSVRLLAFTASCTGMTAVAAGAVFGARFGLGWPVPLWAIYAAGGLLVILSQAVMVSLALVLNNIGNRAGTSFIPLRDAAYFIDRLERVSPDEQLSLHRLGTGTICDSPKVEELLSQLSCAISQR